MKRIHALTIQANYELRIDLEDFENSTSFAKYGSFGVGLFSVDPDEDGYPLSVADYSGTAGMLHIILPLTESSCVTGSVEPKTITFSAKAEVSQKAIGHSVLLLKLCILKTSCTSAVQSWTCIDVWSQSSCQV